MLGLGRGIGNIYFFKEFERQYAVSKKRLYISKIKLILMIDCWCISCEIDPSYMWLNLTDDVNIGSGNGLVLSSNKQLPEPMLTEIHVAILRHYAIMV